MRRSVLLVILLILAMSLFGSYNVGDIVDNYFWTDNTGTAHDIYELTSQGVAIVMFWGGFS